MAHGLITANGGEPLAEWRLRISLLGSAELGAAVSELLAGEPVSSRDGQLEISQVLIAARTRTFRVTVRIPEAPYVADLVLRPATPADAVPDLEPKSTDQLPDAWATPHGEVVRWQLFNCVLHRLTSRSNTT